MAHLNFNVINLIITVYILVIYKKINNEKEKRNKVSNSPTTFENVYLKLLITKITLFLDYQILIAPFRFFNLMNFFEFWKLICCGRDESFLL